MSCLDVACLLGRASSGSASAMTMSMSAWWWLATGAAVAVEVVTGTFYLLMMGLGMAAGAISASLGLATSGQLIVAAGVGVGATALLSWRRARRPCAPAANENRDVNLDIGERIDVTRWDADRTARVHYRGSAWTARLAPGARPVAGEHRVVAVEGNWLVLAAFESS